MRTQVVIALIMSLVAVCAAITITLSPGSLSVTSVKVNGLSSWTEPIDVSVSAPGTFEINITCSAGECGSATYGIEFSPSLGVSNYTFTDATVTSCFANMSAIVPRAEIPASFVPGFCAGLFCLDQTAQKGSCIIDVVDFIPNVTNRMNATMRIFAESSSSARVYTAPLTLSFCAANHTQICYSPPDAQGRSVPGSIDCDGVCSAQIAPTAVTAIAAEMMLIRPYHSDLDGTPVYEAPRWVNLTKLETPRWADVVLAIRTKPFAIGQAVGIYANYTTAPNLSLAASNTRTEEAVLLTRWEPVTLSPGVYVYEVNYSNNPVSLGHALFEINRSGFHTLSSVQVAGSMFCVGPDGESFNPGEGAWYYSELSPAFPLTCNGQYRACLPTANPQVYALNGSVAHVFPSCANWQVGAWTACGGLSCSDQTRTRTCTNSSGFAVASGFCHAVLPSILQPCQNTCTGQCGPAAGSYADNAITLNSPYCLNKRSSDANPPLVSPTPGGVYNWSCGNVSFGDSVIACQATIDPLGVCGADNRTFSWDDNSYPSNRCLLGDVIGAPATLNPGESIGWFCRVNSRGNGVYCGSRRESPPTCGSWDGQTVGYNLATLPNLSTNNLCGVGKVRVGGSFVESVPFVGLLASWECVNTLGGVGVSCDATKTNAPQCGTAAYLTYPVGSTQTSGTLCSIGTGSQVAPISFVTDDIYWDCQDTASISAGPVQQCVASRLVPANGVCGSAHGDVYAKTDRSGFTPAAPVQNTFCVFPSQIMAPYGSDLIMFNQYNKTHDVDQNFSWTCSGQNGGSAISCSATRTSSNGACGDADGFEYEKTDSDWQGRSLCSQGSISLDGVNIFSGNIDTQFPPIGGSTGWYCKSTDGGVDSGYCFANRKDDPINGVCVNYPTYSYDSGASIGGNFADFCSAGTVWKIPCGNCPDAISFTPAVTTGQTLSWTCMGSWGGADVACSATKEAQNLNPVDGVCGAAATSYGSSDSSFIGNFCSSGNSSPPSPSFPAQGGQTDWTCLGINNGTNSATCSASRAKPCAPDNFAPNSPTHGACCAGTNDYAGICQAPENGVCVINAAQDFNFAGAPPLGYCSSTNGSSSTPVFNGATTTGETLTWTCNGAYGGSASAQCSATKRSATSCVDFRVGRNSFVIGNGASVTYFLVSSRSECDPVPSAFSSTCTNGVWVPAPANPAYESYTTTSCSFTEYCTGPVRNYFPIHPPNCASGACIGTLQQDCSVRLCKADGSIFQNGQCSAPGGVSSCTDGVLYDTCDGTRIVLGKTMQEVGCDVDMLTAGNQPGRMAGVDCLLEELPPQCAPVSTNAWNFAGAPTFGYCTSGDPSVSPVFSGADTDGQVLNWNCANTKGTIACSESKPAAVGCTDPRENQSGSFTHGQTIPYYDKLTVLDCAGSCVASTAQCSNGAWVDTLMGTGINLPAYTTCTQNTCRPDEYCGPTTSLGVVIQNAIRFHFDQNPHYILPTFAQMCSGSVCRSPSVEDCTVPLCYNGNVYGQGRCEDVGAPHDTQKQCGIGPVTDTCSGQVTIDGQIYNKLSCGADRRAPDVACGLSLVPPPPGDNPICALNPVYAYDYGGSPQYCRPGYGSQTSSPTFNSADESGQVISWLCLDGITTKFCSASKAAATCSDNIQNQGETAVDLGGPCGGSVVYTCHDSYYQDTIVTILASNGLPVNGLYFQAGNSFCALAKPGFASSYTSQYKSFSSPDNNWVAADVSGVFQPVKATNWNKYAREVVCVTPGGNCPNRCGNGVLEASETCEIGDTLSIENVCSGGMDNLVCRGDCLGYEAARVEREASFTTACN